MNDYKKALKALDTDTLLGMLDREFDNSNEEKGNAVLAELNRRKNTCTNCDTEDAGEIINGICGSCRYEIGLLS